MRKVLTTAAASLAHQRPEHPLSIGSALLENDYTRLQGAFADRHLRTTNSVLLPGVA